eukprot:7174446-Prymnesium_polylepis.1
MVLMGCRRVHWYVANDTRYAVDLRGRYGRQRHRQEAFVRPCATPLGAYRGANAERRDPCVEPRRTAAATLEEAWDRTT